VANVARDIFELLMPGLQFTVWSRNDRTPFPNLGEKQDVERAWMISA
jgi:hypothetical protein